MLYSSHNHLITSQLGNMVRTFLPLTINSIVYIFIIFCTVIMVSCGDCYALYLMHRLCSILLGIVLLFGLFGVFISVFSSYPVISMRLRMHFLLCCSNRSINIFVV